MEDKLVKRVVENAKKVVEEKMETGDKFTDDEEHQSNISVKMPSDAAPTTPDAFDVMPTDAPPSTPIGVPSRAPPAISAVQENVVMEIPEKNSFPESTGSPPLAPANVPSALPESPLRTKDQKSEKNSVSQEGSITEVVAKNTLTDQAEVPNLAHVDSLVEKVSAESKTEDLHTDRSFLTPAEIDEKAKVIQDSEMHPAEAPPAVPNVAVPLVDSEIGSEESKFTGQVKLNDLENKLSSSSESVDSKGNPRVKDFDPVIEELAKKLDISLKKTNFSPEMAMEAKISPPQTQVEVDSSAPKSSDHSESTPKIPSQISDLSDSANTVPSVSINDDEPLMNSMNRTSISKNVKSNNDKLADGDSKPKSKKSFFSKFLNFFKLC
eukprot:NODE_910_length_3155_cov_0.267343.p2 type:complete len:380 gc:universal NODE_910_length_3155_cov_0.267343:178-1317(+)